ncbi:guanine nucleotide-binding protein-like protein G(o) subunit alpha [Chytriomyces sp. MP71]|nr:guanine nucleotide-binding protein-like protein G(o) subunit alpha [Chytriomyces sp. MP71]
MGGCTSKEAPASLNTTSPAESKQATAKSKEIDKQLSDEKATSKDIKILLLGTAETGKSTVLKQLRIIHGGGFTDDDIKTFRCTAKKNIYDTAKTLVLAMEELKIPREEVQASIDLLLASEPLYHETLPMKLVEAIKLVWSDSGVQYCFSRSNEFQIIDLFMQDIDRFIACDYIPTNQDILASRVMTSGVSETKVIIKGTVFRVFDVGGQRNERKKWIHVFDNVNAIFFLFDLSAFNQMTVEDTNINRVVESLTVFTFICNHNVFKKTAMIIFMNKIDLLRDKLEHSMVQDYFPEFTSTNDYKEVSKFFAEKIASFNKNPDKQLYFHYTQANDTTKMKAVLATVIESILV